MLTELLPPERIRVPLGSHSRHALLHELVEMAFPDADLATMEVVFQSVLSREALMSTALGEGLAVPHGRTDAVRTPVMAAGIVGAMDDYSAPDGTPVCACFLLVTPPTDGGAHLKVLGRLARLVRREDLRNALYAAADAASFAAVLRRAEAS